MSVPKAITLTTGGFGTEGFTFSVLSNQTGNTEAQRDQFEDPFFDKDYDNQPFVAGTVYRFLGYHPRFLPTEELVRVVFKESGGYEILDPSEDPDGSTPTTPGIGGNITFLVDGAETGQIYRIQKVGNTYYGIPSALPTLQEITNVGSVTDKTIKAGQFVRNTFGTPITNPVAFVGISANTPNDFALEPVYANTVKAIIGAPDAEIGGASAGDELTVRVNPDGSRTIVSTKPKGLDATVKNGNVTGVAIEAGGYIRPGVTLLPTTANGSKLALWYFNGTKYALEAVNLDAITNDLLATLSEDQLISLATKLAPLISPSDDELVYEIGTDVHCRDTVQQITNSFVLDPPGGLYNNVAYPIPYDNYKTLTVQVLNEDGTRNDSVGYDIKSNPSKLIPIVPLDADDNDTAFDGRFIITNHAS